jgi:hypothetical protein
LSVIGCASQSAARGYVIEDGLQPSDIATNDFIDASLEF